MLLVSGVEELGLLLFGVDVEFGFAVLFGFDEFISVLLEPDDAGELVVSVLDGDVVVELELGLDGEVEFISELLESVVDDGDEEELEPLWLDWVEGVLCALLAPLPAPLASFEVEPALLCATAMPVEKITAVASVKSFLLIRDNLLSA